MGRAAPDPRGQPAARIVSRAEPGGIWLRLLAALALAAELMARVVAPALPGSMTGIERWIVLSEKIAAYLSQLFVMAGSLVTISLLSAVLREPRHGVAFRLLAVPIVAAVVTLVIAAATVPIDPIWTLGLGLLAAGLAVAVTPRALRHPHTRAVGFVLGLAAAAAVLNVASRFVALHASELALQRTFVGAQVLATCALVLDMAATVVAALWLASRRWRLAAVTSAAVLGMCLLVAWGALQGSRYGAPLWQVLAARGLAELSRHPLPLLPAGLRHLTELVILCTTGLVLLGRRNRHGLAAAVALVLLAHDATDLPALALAVTLSALIAALSASPQDRAPHAAPSAASVPQEPTAESHLDGAADDSPPRRCHRERRPRRIERGSHET